MDIDGQHYNEAVHEDQLTHLSFAVYVCLLKYIYVATTHGCLVALPESLYTIHCTVMKSRWTFLEHNGLGQFDYPRKVLYCRANYPSSYYLILA
jgi:hypothetical protein